MKKGPTSKIVNALITVTLLHAATVILCAAAYLGVARAARDTANRNPPALRVVRTTGDILSFPTSLFLWMRGEEGFPWSSNRLLITSPLWGFAAAYLINRRKSISDCGRE
jgi:hypothetical protein